MMSTCATAVDRGDRRLRSVGELDLRKEAIEALTKLVPDAPLSRIHNRGNHGASARNSDCSSRDSGWPTVALASDDGADEETETGGSTDGRLLRCSALRVMRCEHSVMSHDPRQ